MHTKLPLRELQLMQRKLKNMPMCFRIFFGMSFFLSMALYGFFIHYVFWRNTLSNESFLEMSYCPICYGFTLCDQLLAGKGDLQGPSRIRWFNKISNMKNVYYGHFDGVPAVFKKLAHDSELQKFDKHNSNPEESRKLLRAHHVKGLSDLTFCPSERLVDKMVVKYKEKVDAAELNHRETIQLMTTLKINPEPLVSQIFPQEEGYPFPKYYGACGRFVVQEYIGRSLGSFVDAPWSERAGYVYQILRIADFFANTTDQFALYLLDVDTDNFAVSPSGKVYIVDLENIAAVDLHQLNQDAPPDYNIPHVAPVDPCSSEKSYLTIPNQDLCSHLRSDFNYHAICHELLSECSSKKGTPAGFLHNIPSNVETKYNFQKLLNNCLHPKSEDRFYIKDQLLKILKEASTNVKNYDSYSLK